MDTCFETDWWTCNIYRYTASWKRSIANNVYANTSKRHIVNIKQNIQTLWQTSVTQHSAVFINLELNWTVMTARFAHADSEIYIRVTNTSLCTMENISWQIRGTGHTETPGGAGGGGGRAGASVCSLILCTENWCSIFISNLSPHKSPTRSATSLKHRNNVLKSHIFIQNLYLIPEIHFVGKFYLVT
jgi:hypothetical protein